MGLNKNFWFGLLMTVLVCFGLAITGHGLSFLKSILVFLVCYPWTTSSGNVYSLFGGFSEKSIASMFGIVQVAKNDAFCFCALNICQYADGEAIQIFGISLIQHGGTWAAQFAGLSGYQNSAVVAHGLGMTLWQKGSQDNLPASINIYHTY